MGTMKRALDPAGILSPGKIIIDHSERVWEFSFVA